MFFAITGSSEDAGPTSTVVFNKPGSKKSLGEIEPPDPFSRKTFGSAEYAQKTSFAPKTPEPVQSSPVPSAPAVAATAAAATATTFTTKSETPSYSAPSYSTPTYETQSVPETTYEQPVKEPVYETAQTEEYVAESYTQQEDTTYYTQSSEVPYEQVTEPSYAETAYAESPAEEPALDNTSFYDMSATTAAPEESPAIVKSDLTYGGGVSMFSSVGSGPKKKEKYARPITAPDAYNGLYYSGSDSEESYESNYGSGSLLDRGGLYGKTIGGTTSDNPFSNVLSGTAPSTSTFGSSLGSHSTFAPGSESSGTYGGSLFHKDAAPSQESASSSGHLTFTTKGGSTPFANGSYMSAPPSADYKGPSTTKKGGKTLNRYSADDFAAWERENYADDFKPRGGFGNNIF